MMSRKYPKLDRLLKARKRLEIVDSHTCGQPTRVILGGTGLKDGMTPAEGRDYLRSHADWVRRLAVMEPRGHRSMFGAAIIYPDVPGNPFGVVYMDAGTYPDMCGHATIGVATTLYELGLVGSAEIEGSTSEYPFELQSPAGTIEIRAKIRDGVCHAIAFQMPLAYYVGSVEITLANCQVARLDIGWAGQYYAFVPVDSIGLEINPDNIDQLIAAAIPIRKQLALSCSIVDPRTNVVPEVGNIVWTSSPQHAAAQARNVPISSSHSFDRSPCGTATCARMAILEARGEIEIGQTFTNESILGTLYYGRVISRYNGDGFQGIRPEIQASAWLTAASTLSCDPTDSLGLGYLIGGGAAVL